MITYLSPSDILVITQWLSLILPRIGIEVIVKSHYEEVIAVITRVRGGAKHEYECNNNDNL